MPPEDTVTQPAAQPPQPQPVRINPSPIPTPLAQPAAVNLPSQPSPQPLPVNSPQSPPGPETVVKPKKSLGAWGLAVFYLLYLIFLVFVAITQFNSNSLNIIAFSVQILIGLFIFLSLIFYSRILMTISYIYIGFWLLVTTILDVGFFIPQLLSPLSKFFNNSFISSTFGFLATILLDITTIVKIIPITISISFWSFYIIGAVISIPTLIILRFSIASFGKAEGVKKFIPEASIILLIVLYGITTFTGNIFFSGIFSKAPNAPKFESINTKQFSTPPPNVAPAPFSQTTNLSPTNKIDIFHMTESLQLVVNHDSCQAPQKAGIQYLEIDFNQSNNNYLSTLKTENFKLNLQFSNGQKTTYLQTTCSSLGSNPSVTTSYLVYAVPEGINKGSLDIIDGVNSQTIDLIRLNDLNK